MVTEISKHDSIVTALCTYSTTELGNKNKAWHDNLVSFNLTDCCNKEIYGKCRVHCEPMQIIIAL